MAYEYEYCVFLWREENPGHWGWKEIGHWTCEYAAIDAAKWWKAQGINSKVVEFRTKTVVEYS